MMKHVHVAVGIIRDADRQILLAQRPDDSPMAKMWEFPGGKIETGESPIEALQRELLEETGITVKTAEFYANAEHAYPDFRVTLYFFIIEEWIGEPWGREQQPIRWVPQIQLDAAQFPPASISVVIRLLEEAKN